MSLVDLIPGLSVVNQRVGLANLDQGLRESIGIDPRTLPAQQQLSHLDGQVAGANSAIGRLRRQVEDARKRKQFDLQTQLLAQINQQETHLRQLVRERQRLEADLRQQQIQAQEREVMRMLADLYTQTLDFQRQGRVLDCVTVTLALLRICRQVSGRLDNPAYRVQVADLQGKLYEALGAVFESAGSIAELTRQYVGALTPLVDIRKRVQYALEDAQKALETAVTLRSAPVDGDWTRSVAACDTAAAGLERSRGFVTQARAELVGLLAAPELSEVFFPVFCTMDGTRLAAKWNSWIQGLDAALGSSLRVLYQGFGELSVALQQNEAGLRAAEAEVGRLRSQHQLGSSAAHLIGIWPAYQARYQQLKEVYSALPAIMPVTQPAQLVDVFLTAARLRHALQAEFAPYFQVLDASGFGSGGRLRAEAVQRLSALGGIEAVISVGDLTSAYALHAAVRQLAAQAAEVVKVARRLINRALESDEGFDALLVPLHGSVPEDQAREVVDRVASRAPSMSDRVRGLLGGARGLELDRRRRVLDGLLQCAGIAESLPGAVLPYAFDAPKMKGFALGSPLAIGIPQSVAGRAGLALGIVAVLFAFGLVSMLFARAGASFAPLDATTTATVHAAPEVESTRPPVRATQAVPIGSATARPQPPVVVPTSTVRRTDTPEPTDTATAEPTRTPTASVTPSQTEAPTNTPEPSPTPKPTNTPRPAPTYTRPPVPTRTPQPPTSTSVPQPTQPPAPPPGVNGNPWGYNFECCNYIYSPPAEFCNYFACIGNFWNGRGYVMQCKDEMYSKSGGIQGSCSHHGGNYRALLAP